MERVKSGLRRMQTVYRRDILILFFLLVFLIPSSFLPHPSFLSPFLLFAILWFLPLFLLPLDTLKKSAKEKWKRKRGLTFQREERKSNKRKWFKSFRSHSWKEWPITDTGCWWFQRGIGKKGDTSAPPWHEVIAECRYVWASCAGAS